MTPGKRTHKSASLRVAIPTGFPVEFWETCRELVSVQSSAQGRGDATALVWATCREADQAWLALIVKPEVFAPGLTIERLRRWYAKFGFVEIQAQPCLLARVPTINVDKSQRARARHFALAVQTANARRPERVVRIAHG
jgi:hypothetical protein